MKLLAKIFCSAALVSIVAGCASNSVYIPKVPDDVKQALLDYEKQADNKVFILAVDPDGQFAYAYEYGRATLKEAAKIAVEKIDALRKANSVLGRPYVYALNDKVVWEDMIRSAQEGPAEKERSAQKAEYEEMKAEGEVDEASMEEVAEDEAGSMGIEPVAKTMQ